MLTAILAAAAMAPAQTSVTPGSLISRMLARYAEATAVSGEVTFRQTAEGKSLFIDTRFQMERPRLLYIRQQRRGSNEVSLTVSDGIAFTYEVPRHLRERNDQRLYEQQNQNGVLLNVTDVYAASQEGFLDRSPVLDLVVARTEHLRFWRNQVLNLRWMNDAAPAVGQSGTIIGDWRQYGSAPITGRFILSISPQGDLLRYAISEKVSVKGSRPVEVTSEWTADLKVGSPGDKALFRVVRR